jgi:amino acid adenylation domain-containing protein
VTNRDSSAVDAQLKNLSTAKRAFLEQRLMEKRLAVAAKNAISPRPVKTPVPLSYSQELLWLLSQVFYDGVAYNAPATFRLEGALDVSALQSALDALVERHEILRTTYEVIGDRPMQVVHDRMPIEVRLVDLTGASVDDQERRVDSILLEESQGPFDLVQGPVIRSTVIKRRPDDHIFMLVLHHIATDGYSRAILFSDLTELYEAAVRGRPPKLPALAIQYADYAVWHRNWLEAGALQEQLAYWRQRLTGAPSRLDLPTDFPRSPIRSYHGDHESLRLDMSTLEGLRSTARQGDGTLFVSLVAVFAALLHRYSAQDDIVIGTPFAGRNRSELENMIGYFINPLPLRIDLSGDPTFLELVQRARETAVEAFAHADVPYEMVVRETNPERDLSQTPVFQAMLVLHNPEWISSRPTFQPSGIRAAELSHTKGWSKFDLLLGMSERRDGLNATFEYSTELFKAETLSRMLEHFRTLATNAATRSDVRLSKLSMLSEAERSRVLVSWNPPARAAQNETIKELFERQIARTPDATAVVCQQERVTFAELNRRANRIAWRLRREGAGPQTLVGIFLEKSIDAVAAVLGVMKCGAAYIPLDPVHPSDRLEFMVTDAKPALLLTQAALRTELSPADATVIDVDDGFPGEREDDPPTIGGASDLAYVIYTSGSTGRPKGVMIDNGNLTSAYFAYEEAYRLHELRCHLQLANISFDVFTGDIVRALASGAKLVLAPLDVVVDPAQLYELMARERVDAAEFVPASATLLFEYAEQQGLSLDFMRLLCVGGEAWRADKYELFRRVCGSETRIINSYGLTEATMDSTWLELSDDLQLHPERFVPIGRPFANTRIYILGEDGEPTPVGIPGELCIGGAAVGRGYLNRSDLTEERFVADPFSSEPGARLYRTGDLARWQPDGTIDFIGRADRQVKIRGFRIEPGEIEAVLERHPQVQRAAVTARVDADGDTRLVGYVIPAQPDSTIEPAEVYEFLAERVPAYMIPAAWMTLSTPPLTPSGKIDVNALPEPEWDLPSTVEFVAPRTETERRLADIWGELLSVKQVGATDNFFALGGHSLLAVRLFAQIEEKFGKKLTLTTLFRGATIEQLAAAIEADDGNAQTHPTVHAVRPRGNRPPLFIIGGIDGEVIHYRGLVAALDADQPIYALQPEGVDSAAAPKMTVEEMAADYVRDLLAFRPGGPYLIAGYCYSGYVAWEVARQLNESDNPAAMLALIDTGAARPRITRVQLERQKLADFRAADFKGKRAWIARRSRGLKRKVELAIRWCLADLFRRLSLPMPRSLRNLREAGFRAWKRYQMQPAPIHMTLFRADEAGTDWSRAALWHRYATGGVKIVPLRGQGIRHDNLMREPHVHELARGLHAAIDDALSNGAGTPVVDAQRPDELASAASVD